MNDYSKTSASYVSRPIMDAAQELHTVPAVHSTHNRYLPGGMDVSPSSILSPAEPREKPGPTWQRRGRRRKPTIRHGWPSGRRCGLLVATPCWSPCARCATATLSVGSWCTTMCGLSSTTRTSDRAPASETSSATTSGAREWRTIRATSPTDRCASSPSSKFSRCPNSALSTGNEHLVLV